MAESNLTKVFTDYQAEVGFSLNYGRTAANWSAAQTSFVAAIIRAGITRFYTAKKWKFLRVLGTVATVAGTQTYTMPDDFSGMESDPTYAAGTVGPIINEVMEEEIRLWNESNTSNSKPYAYAVRPITQAVGAAAQRYQMMLYPIPNAVYTLTYRYRKMPDNIDATNIYAYGGMEVSEALLETMLGVAQHRAYGVPEAVAMEVANRLTEAAWAKDKTFASPGVLGVMGAREGRHNRYYEYDISRNHRRWPSA